MFVKGEDCNGVDTNRLSTDSEDRQLTMFEKMVSILVKKKFAEQSFVNPSNAIIQINCSMVFTG